MTVPSSEREQRGGAIRSSHAPLTVLVMSGDGPRRNDWAEFFDREGMRVLRCAGPEVATCALTVQRRCPLQDEADLIFYDQKSVTSELEGRLDLVPLTAPIAYSNSGRTPEGRESPVATRIRSARRGQSDGWG